MSNKALLLLCTPRNALVLEMKVHLYFLNNEFDRLFISYEEIPTGITY